MHLESFGIETGDPKQPYLARVTVGTRKRRETLHEWPAASVAAAKAQANDWCWEWSARIEGKIEDETVEDAAARAARLKTYGKLPDLPWAPRGWPRVTGAPPRTQVVGASTAQAHTSSPQPVAVAGLRKTIRSRVHQVVSAARAAKIDVVGVRVWPDGSIAAFDARSSFSAPASDPDPANAPERPNSFD